MNSMSSQIKIEKNRSHIQKYFEKNDSIDNGLQFLENCHFTLDEIYKYMKSECPHAIEEHEMLQEGKKIIKYHINTMPQEWINKLSSK